MTRKYVLTHLYDTEGEAQSAHALLMSKFSSSLEKIKIVKAPYGFILQIDSKEISEELFEEVKAEIESRPAPGTSRKPEKPGRPIRAEAAGKPAEKPSEPKPKPEPAQKPSEKKPKAKPAEKPPKPKPKPAGTARPVRPAPKATGPAPPKRKSVAVWLAVFLGLWSWLYTYQNNKRKFWSNLVLTACTLGFWGVVSWIWAIVDAALKPSDYYQGYPAVKAVYPKKASFLIVISIIVTLTVAITLFGNLVGGNSNKMNSADIAKLAADASANIPVIQTPAWQAASSSRPTINSNYALASSPVIDGVLSPGEWPGPVLDKTFTCLFKNAEKTGRITGYFKNDDDSLYVLITVTAGNFAPYVLDKEKALLSLDIFFDENNDSILRQGEDNKKFWKSEYQDCHQKQKEKPYSTEWDGQQDGKGTRNYSDTTGTYVYECQIPLNSGDNEDLAVKPGDTIGIRVVLTEYIETEANKRYMNIGYDSWPTGQGWIDGTYGQLVLAKKSSSTPSAPPVPSPAPSQTPPPSSQKSLFEDNFSNSGSGWRAGSDEYSVKAYENGEYSMLSKKANQLVWQSCPSIESQKDFTVEVDFRKLSGESDHAAGIAFRHQDDNNYYRCYLRSDGTYSIGKKFQGTWYTFKDWTKSTYIKTGTGTNRLKVVCNGAQIEIYINGYKLDTVNDSSIASGSILLAVADWETSGAHYHFDNFKLYSGAVTSTTPAPATTPPPAPTPTPTLTPTPTTSPQLLFEDNFNDSKSGWVISSGSSGTWAYENGDYSLSTPKPGSFEHVFGRNKLFGKQTDFTVEVDARDISKESDGWYGIFFREDPDYSTSGFTYYAFLVNSSNGKYKIVKSVRNNWSTLKDWTYSEYIKTSTNTNRLKVNCKGTMIGVYANGQLLATVTDDLITKGYIALAISGTNTHAHFDNFKLYTGAVTSSAPAPATDTAQPVYGRPGFGNTRL